MAKDKETKNAEVKAEHTGSVSGAESVADAVKRVADAAVAEVQKTSAALLETDFRVSGTANGNFEIVSHGKNLGSSGTVQFNGVDAKTTEWSTTRIKGTVPAGMHDADVVVHVDDQTNYSARFKG